MGQPSLLWKQQLQDLVICYVTFSTWQRGWNHLVELKDVKKRISSRLDDFYWSWWLVYAPFIGLFIARISKGRRLKEVILGTIVYGTLGCVLFFGIFGNYAVYLQISEQFNVIQYLNSHGTEATIIEVMHQLPFPTTVIVLFLLSAFLFLATTFDSGSYILAAATQKKVLGEPLKANRLFWAFALCLLPFSLMLVGGERALEVLKLRQY